MASVSSKPRVVVVGFGRLGGALCLGLKRARIPVSALPRSGGSIREATRLRIPLADPETLERADLCVLAVPDTAIADVAADVLPDLGSKTALIHCAGALDLTAFGPAAESHVRGSFHPLCAVSSREDSLAGHTVAIAATRPALARTLASVGRAVGLNPISVDERHRAAYHAGAMLSAGGLVAVASAAVESLGRAGIPPADALEALIPLMRSAISGLERRGLPDALTGPVVRGDAEVIAHHLADIPQATREIYRAVTTRMLALARGKISPKQLRAIATLLRSR